MKEHFITTSLCDNKVHFFGTFPNNISMCLTEEFQPDNADKRRAIKTVQLKHVSDIFSNSGTSQAVI